VSNEDRMEIIRIARGFIINDDYTLAMATEYMYYEGLLDSDDDTATAYKLLIG